MPQTRPLWLTVAGGALVALLAGHLVATAIFVGPDNAAKETLGRSLTAYMQPVFQQEWSLFAPAPISTGYSLWVRGWYDENRATDWVDATRIELEGNIRHSFAPSRAGIVTRRLAGIMRKQHRAITQGERDVLAEHFHENAWSQLEQRIRALPEHSSDARISYVLRVDRAMAAYATQFAWAWWGRDAGITYVQVKIVETRAPRFHERGQAPRSVTREFGRRPLYMYDAQDSRAFTEAIARFQA